MTQISESPVPTVDPVTPQVTGDPGVLEVHRCAPGSPPERLTTLPVSLPDDGVSVLWVDVDPGAAPADLLRTLADLAPTLCESDVADLLERDELAKSHDRPDGFRNASVVGFAVQPPASESPEVGDLLVQMVESLVGDRLLLTCWQQSRLFRGAEALGDEAPALREDVGADVRRTWSVDGCETAADLASALVEATLVRSRSVTCDLEHWLQAWELRYHALADGADSETGTLKRLLAMVNETRRRLSAFENARPVGAAPTDARFERTAVPTLEERADRLIETTLKRLGVLLEGIRSTMELVSMDKVAHQAQLAEERAERDGHFQGRLEKVTALLLVPTLIAGIFGANTALPGGGTWAGFDAMVVLMVATSVAVYAFLVSRRKLTLPRKRGE